MEFREESPDGTLQEAMRHMELKKKDRLKLGKVLTDKSRCRSLWVIARGKTRNWYHLYVDQDGDMENDAQNWTLAW